MQQERDQNVPRKISDEIFCTDEIKKRKIQPQNAVIRIVQREAGLGRPGTHFHKTRLFYTSVYPNFTASNVLKPPGYLRKFSPNGKYLVAFSIDQTCVEVYRYNGVSAAGSLMANLKENVGSINADPRSRLFDAIFSVTILWISIHLLMMLKLNHFSLSIQLKCLVK